ncbi:helix-turn-helix transcriptional regulator [Chitinophagaceae bacterium MMS25-I14]
MKKEYATHHGRNVKRLREILGIKQEALAIELGSEWNQKKISALESRPTIDEDLLERVAEALKMPVETIKGFDDEMTIYNIQNNYDGSNAGAGEVGNIGSNYHECTFNPFDKIVELMEEIKKLHTEKETLYERMLQDKDAVIKALGK